MTTVVLWIVAALAYAAYAILAVAQTTVATKANVAGVFLLISLVLYLALRHHHDGGR